MAETRYVSGSRKLKGTLGETDATANVDSSTAPFLESNLTWHWNDAAPAGFQLLEQSRYSRN